MKLYFVLEQVEGKGGVEEVVSKVSNDLTSKGHEVHVLLPLPSNDIKWEKTIPNVHYYHKKVEIFDRIHFFAERAIGLSNTLVNLPKPDIIIATHVPQTVFYSRMAIGPAEPIPIISWLHNPPEQFYESHLINYADGHWAISKGIKKSIEDILTRDTPVSYIGNPFELNVKEIPPVIGPYFSYIGRLENNQKRLDILFYALSHLNEPWRLDVYGTGPDEDELKSLAFDLNIVNNICFHGWVDDPWEKIQKITSLILTSDFEGMPMVIGEAMTRGVPVISTDCRTGPSDLIKSSQSGWLTPIGDIQELLSTLQKVSLLSQKELNIISRNAKESLEYYSIHKVMERMIKSINDIKIFESEVH